jgi:hypothetical protein
MPQEFDRLVEEVVIKQRKNDGRYSLQVKGTIYVKGMNILNMPTKGLHWEPFTTEMGAWDTIDEARDAGQRYCIGLEEDSKYVEKIGESLCASC